MSDVQRRQEEDNDEPFDPDRRELCSDGMCVGVIGKDGRCKVCGKPGSGGAPGAERSSDAGGEAPGGWRPAAVPVGEEEGSGAEEKAEAEEGGGVPPEAGKPDFERTRVPCSDDMCTGIIGRSGRCGTCGKPWSGSGD